MHPLRVLTIAAAVVVPTFVAVATPVLGADLDDLAQCESGGNPNYEDGTYSGAFNYLPSTWTSQGLPGRPSDHSYETQKAAAAALIRRSGQASQFPGCTAKLGTVSINETAPSVVAPSPSSRTVAPSAPATQSRQRLAVTG